MTDSTAVDSATAGGASSRRYHHTSRRPSSGNRPVEDLGGFDEAGMVEGERRDVADGDVGELPDAVAAAARVVVGPPPDATPTAACYRGYGREPWPG